MPSHEHVCGLLDAPVYTGRFSKSLFCISFPKPLPFRISHLSLLALTVLPCHRWLQLVYSPLHAFNKHHPGKSLQPWKSSKAGETKASPWAYFPGNHKTGQNTQHSSLKERSTLLPLEPESFCRNADHRPHGCCPAEKRGFVSGWLKTIVLPSPTSAASFFIKHSPDDCKFFRRFQSSEKVDSDSFCQFNHSFSGET